MPQPLNTFETRLLDQLQEQVAAQPRPATATRRPTAAKVGLAVAASAAMVAGGVGLTHETAQPAWAVDPHSDGTVTITVNRPTGAAELQARLAEVGIPASVQFPADGSHCAGWNDGKKFRDSAESGVTHAILGTHKVEVTVVPSQARKGTTLLIEVATRNGIEAMLANLESVSGPAPACHLTPITDDDINPPR